jgi:hypothetical protein
MTERVKGTSGASRLEDVAYIEEPKKREEIKWVRTAGLVGKAKQLAELTGVHVTLIVQDPSKGPQVMFSTNGDFDRNVREFERVHTLHLKEMAEKAAAESSPVARVGGKIKEPSGKRARLNPPEDSPVETKRPTGSKRSGTSKHLKNRLKVCKDSVYVVPSDEFSSTIGANVRQISFNLSLNDSFQNQLQLGSSDILVQVSDEKLEEATVLPTTNPIAESVEIPLPKTTTPPIMLILPKVSWRVPRLASGLCLYPFTVVGEH